MFSPVSILFLTLVTFCLDVFSFLAISETTPYCIPIFFVFSLFQKVFTFVLSLVLRLCLHLQSKELFLNKSRETQEKL